MRFRDKCLNSHADEVCRDDRATGFETATGVPWMQAKSELPSSAPSSRRSSHDGIRRTSSMQPVGSANWSGSTPRQARSAPLESRLNRGNQKIGHWNPIPIIQLFTHGSPLSRRSRIPAQFTAIPGNAPFRRTWRRLDRRAGRHWHEAVVRINRKIGSHSHDS